MLNLQLGPPTRFRQSDVPKIDYKKVGAQNVSFEHLVDHSYPIPGTRIEIEAWNQAGGAMSTFTAVCIAQTPERKVLTNPDRSIGRVTFDLPSSEWGLRAELLLAFPEKSAEVTVTLEDDFGRSVSQKCRW